MTLSIAFGKANRSGTGARPPVLGNAKRDGSLLVSTCLRKAYRRLLVDTLP
jgi:hypothetical protein